MKKSAPPWWQLPAIIAGSVAALTALGTIIVKSAAYITLPERVEASEQRNQAQDSAIDKLTAIQQTWQNIYQQQQQHSGVKRLWDDAAEAWYCDDGRDQYWADRNGSCD